MTRAAFPGRFQPFHRGHYRTVRTYRQRYAEFVVAVGSPQKSRTDHDPLTADEREEQIRACFPSVEVVRVRDEDRGEEGYPVWAERLVRETDADVIISGNDLVQRLVREYTEADVHQQEMHYPEKFSGTEIRRRIRADEAWRDLVPDCCEDVVAQYVDVIRESG